MDNNIQAAHKVPIPDVPWYKTSRYHLALWSFFGFLNVYALRVNLSVAAVKMADQYNWSQSEKAQVLSAFFYGYILTQIPGGWMATRFGAKKVYGFGVLVTVIGTLVTPIVASNTPLLLAVRVLEGFGEGVTFPAMHAMLAKWGPPLERSKLATLCYSGSFFGTVVSLPVSGILANHDFLGGWPAVFYVFGALGVVWFVGWMALTSDSPAKHRWISAEELTYIEESIASQQGTHVNPPTPWKHMLTSSCVWALIINHTCQNWGFYTLLTCLPTYFNDVLRFDIQSGGINAAVPYFALFVVTLIGGQIADYVRTHDLMSTAAIRKLLNTTCYIFASLFLVLAGYVHQGQNTTAVAYLTVSVGIGGLAQSGYNINHLDISPRYAGVLMGLTNAAATIPGFVAPTVAGIVAPCALCDKPLIINGTVYKQSYWQGPDQCPPNQTATNSSSSMAYLRSLPGMDVTPSALDELAKSSTTINASTTASHATSGSSPASHSTSGTSTSSSHPSSTRSPPPSTTTQATTPSGGLPPLPAKYGKFTSCSQHTAQTQWQVVFYISAAVFVFGATVFLFFGRGTVQPWNDPNWTDESKPLLVQT
eukprot:m.57291 g.57291  ORF g.57291 m.57291 type:complete len:592 (-) comp13717_c0_seq2:131-1906(-)